jgi:hypothetical protein
MCGRMQKKPLIPTNRTLMRFLMRHGVAANTEGPDNERFA